jgi:putative transposase
MSQAIQSNLQEAVAQGGSLPRLCQMAGISRACYYRGLSLPETADTQTDLKQTDLKQTDLKQTDLKQTDLKQTDLKQTDLDLREHIQRVALECSCYGYRRVTKELHRQGVQANHKRVLRLMREDNLLCLRKRRFVATTDSDHGLPVYPNLAADMGITTPDELWVSDLTYIRLGHEFIYLAVVLDACSRRCLGWSLGRRLDAALATSALRRALQGRKPQVHHSDRGVQYASYEYTNLLKEHGIAISMSRKGNPYDNAKAESFMKTLKYEQVYLSEYENLADARAQISYFLEQVYNQKRLHSSLSYLPPAEFEEQFEQTHKESRDKNQTITP